MKYGLMISAAVLLATTAFTPASAQTNLLVLALLPAGPDVAFKFKS